MPVAIDQEEERVGAHVVQFSYLPVFECFSLLRRQLIVLHYRLRFSTAALGQFSIAVDVAQQLVDLVEAHVSALLIAKLRAAETTALTKGKETLDSRRWTLDARLYNVASTPAS